MIANIPPGIVIILGALLVPLLAQGRARQLYMLALPLVSLAHLLALDQGSAGLVTVFDYQLILVQHDQLSFVFGLIFHIAACLGLVYAMHVRDPVQQIAALVYPGAAIGALFAGDMITLFIYWEATAISSVFLIWARRSERAYSTGMRYLIIQVGSGVLLLAGVILRAAETGSIAFGDLGQGRDILDFDLATLLIFLAFGIKCAFPLLHNWLQDAYPEATVTGTVILSAFTTKLAVYVLARSFAGTEILIYIGAVMTAFPVFFAVIENDLRRVLAYSLNNQLGFMVVGIGVGTEMALNGTVSHAFAHILYKALLFMAMGAVLFRAGTCKASELGGLFRSMPWTAAFCIVGAMSISAFPLFSGFIAKSLTLSATADTGHVVVWFVLVFASAGVLEHSGIKIPYFAFFAHDNGMRVKEAPPHMLVAMGITAFLCIAIGVYPWPLYDILPYAVTYNPYTVGHVVAQLQLLMFAILAFALLYRLGLYPAELRSTVLNSDWIYRRALPRLVRALGALVDSLRRGSVGQAERRLERFVAQVFRVHGPAGYLARTHAPGPSTIWVAVLLGSMLILYYF